MRVPRHPTNIRRMLDSRVKQVAARNHRWPPAWFRSSVAVASPAATVLRARNTMAIN
jgi:hypothetical protein